MKNAFRVLGRDIMRLLKTPAALVVAIVLVVLPSLYTWFNVIGFWDPYNNTGNMRVCVVNEDAGASNDLLGEMNLGDQIVDQLHENTQLKWEFVSLDEAKEEVSSGEAYAAFVIPEDFTSDLMTILTDNFQQPNIEYYVNEKMNPVSPKVTDAGSTTLDETINSEFVSTVSETVAAVLNEKVNEANSDLTSAQSDVSGDLSKAKDGVAETRSTISDLINEANSAQSKTSNAKSKLQQTYTDAQTMQDKLQSASDKANSVQADLSDFSTRASSSLSEVNSSLSNVSTKAASSVSKAASAAEEAQSLVKQATVWGKTVTKTGEAANKTLQSVLDSYSDVLTDDQRALLQSNLDILSTQNQSIETSLTSLGNLSDGLSSSASAIDGVAQSLNSSNQGALQEGTNYQNVLFGSAIPAVSSGLSQMSASAITLKAAISNHTTLISQTSNVLDQLSGTLDTAANALSQTDSVLATLEQDLGDLQTDVGALSASTSVESLLNSGAIDPEKIAEFMQSPTEVTTEKLYPLNAYGSAMAPLFISLSLWIGCVMLCVILKLEVDDEKVPNLTVAQGWIGRWMFFAILAVLQAVVCVAGCLYIGVQTVSAPLFFLTAMCMSLAYLTIVYTLSSSFQHIGIGLCIILVFVQIPGGTGLYPIEMTPEFFRVLYPIFPFTYGINALRETIAGFYGNQLGQYLGVLLAIGAITGVAGLFLRPQMTNFNRLISRELKANDLVNVEEALVPERKFRVRQLIQALSNHEEFHEGIRAGEERFLRAYPKLKMGALIAGILVPVLSTTVMVLNSGEKVVILTLWLIWLVFIIAFLLVVEYVRAHIQRKADIDSMSDEELYEQLSARRRTSLRELVADRVKRGDRRA